MKKWNEDKYFKHQANYRALLEAIAPGRNASHEKRCAFVNTLEDVLDAEDARADDEDII